MSDENTQGPDRRTVLAADRTIYAAERTYAAWMRTGLTALASGIGAKALLAKVVPEFLIITTATILVAFSAFCFVIAVIREFRPGPPPPEPDVRKIPSGLLLVVSGFLVLVSLAALIGVWFGRSSAAGQVSSGSCGSALATLLMETFCCDLQKGRLQRSPSLQHNIG